MTDDLETRLRRDLPDLARALEVAPLEMASSPARTARRWPALVAVAALVFGGAALVFGGVALLGSREVQQVDTGPDGQTSVDAGSQWVELSTAPIAPRSHAISVWTGTEALFWAGRGEGDSALTDGAAYNPATGTWREIATPGWGHPGVTGLYHDGWLYVTAKGRVSRFNPETGEEHEVVTDPAFVPVTLVNDGDEVLVVGIANDGGDRLAVQKVNLLDATSDRTTGGAGSRTVIFEPGAPAVDWNLSAGVIQRGLLVVVAADGSLWQVSPSTGDASRLPEAERDAADAVSDSVTILGADAGDFWLRRWADDSIEIGQVGDATGGHGISGVAATETVAVAGDRFVLVGGNGGEKAPLVVGPLSSRAETPLVAAPTVLRFGALPNSVWTGEQLIVWGGSGSDAETGAIWTPPADGDSSQAAPDEVDPERNAGAEVEDAFDPGFLDALAALPFDQRLPGDGIELLDAAFADDGIWVYSSPSAEVADGAFREVGEILHLESWEGPILQSWPLLGFPGRNVGVLQVTDEAVYCARQGDGALRDSMVCRIDRATGEITARVFGSGTGDDDAEATGNGYPLQPGWTKEVGAGDTHGPIFSSLWVGEEGPVVAGYGWARLDPLTLAVTEYHPEAESGGPVDACPYLGREVALVPQDDLPPPVAQARAEIFAAATACDFARLSELGGGVPTGFGGGTVEGDLDRGGQGVDWLVELVTVLNLPHATEGDGTIHWPSAFSNMTDSSGSGISAEEYAALSELYPNLDEDFELIGGYARYRIGIGRDGEWLFAIAGGD